MEKEYVRQVVRELDRKSYNYERRAILEKAVEHLKNQNVEVWRIRELFEFEIKQDNSIMLQNNADYLSLLNQVLSS